MVRPPPARFASDAEGGHGPDRGAKRTTLPSSGSLRCHAVASSGPIAKMASCKLCGGTGPLAKSHILPMSLYGSTIGCASGPARIFSGSPVRRPVRSRTGEYDTELLCLDCEASLSLYDGYANELFMQRHPDSIVRDGSSLLAYRYNGVDFERLRLFFITLVWRMHATKREMFQNLTLGKYAEHFRVAALRKDCSAVPEFDIVITKFDYSDAGVLGPSRLRLEGVNGYRFSFAGYSVWAKVDKRQVPSHFDELVLSTGAPLHMLAMEFQDSAEFRAMLRLVQLDGAI